MPRSTAWCRRLCAGASVYGRGPPLDRPRSRCTGRGEHPRCSQRAHGRMTDDAGGKRVTDSTPTAGEPMETGQASERVGDGNIKKSAQLTSFVDLGLQAALHPRNVVL